MDGMVDVEQLCYVKPVERMSGTHILSSRGVGACYTLYLTIQRALSKGQEPNEMKWYCHTSSVAFINTKSITHWADNLAPLYLAIWLWVWVSALVLTTVIFIQVTKTGGSLVESEASLLKERLPYWKRGELPCWTKKGAELPCWAPLWASLGRFDCWAPILVLITVNMY